MPTFSAFGLHIHSEIDLKYLIPSKSSPEIFIKVGKVVLPKKIISRGAYYIIDDNSIYLFYKKIGRFHITKHQIIVDKEANATWGIVEEYLMNQAMASLLHLRGYLVLHGGGISKNGKGYIFLGHSGVGKSTVVKGLCARAFKFLTDDLVAMKKRDDQWWIMPGYPYGKLSEDMATYFGYPSSKDFVSGKTCVVYDQKVYANMECPLHKIFILNEGDVKPITPS